MKTPINMPKPKTETPEEGFLTTFHSPTLGKLNFSEVVSRVMSYVSQNHNQHYKIIIGSDSELLNQHDADFVSAVVVHKIGFGGIYFWSRITRHDMHTLRQRMWEEANYSLMLAQKVMEEFTRNKFSKCNLEIHVDIGKNGDTREMINEIVGMIRGNGFEVKTKPDAYGASNVADKHT